MSERARRGNRITTHSTLPPEVITCEVTILEISRKKLKGKIELNLNFPKLVLEGFFEIRGVAQCRFPLEKIGAKFPFIYLKGTEVSGRQQFFFARQSFCGVHTMGSIDFNNFYDFSCVWPNRLPGTCSTEWGQIEYTCKVIVKFLDSSFVSIEPIVIPSCRLLELEQHLLFESKVSARRNYFFNGNMGSVSVEVWVPLSGLSRGQCLPILCSINNESKLHFGGLIFVLTKIDIYRGEKPVIAKKVVRKDICVVSRLVHVHKGTFDFYAVLKTDVKCPPTNQYYKCKCFETIYEVWVSLRGAFPRYRGYGNPTIDSPGTEPIRQFDSVLITNSILNKLLLMTQSKELQIDLVNVKELFNISEEDLDAETIENLTKQLQTNEYWLKQM